jgi:hypothetical protein
VPPHDRRPAAHHWSLSRHGIDTDSRDGAGTGRRQSLTSPAISMTQAHQRTGGHCAYRGAKNFGPRADFFAHLCSFQEYRHCSSKCEATDRWPAQSRQAGGDTALTLGKAWQSNDGNLWMSIV